MALGLGGLISGSILVEFIFAYPGTGYTLYQSIISQDYTVTQAIANLIIIVTATSVFLLDLLYPLYRPAHYLQKEHALRQEQEDTIGCRTTNQR